MTTRRRMKLAGAPHLLIVPLLVILLLNFFSIEPIESFSTISTNYPSSRRQRSSTSSLLHSSPRTVTPTTTTADNGDDDNDNNDDDWVKTSFIDKEAEADIDVDDDDDDVVIIGPQRVLIYDTTLRDGTQGESVSASVDDKLKIFKRLAAFNVDYIEAGWPGSNPKDAEFFDKVQSETTGLDKIVAFGSTRRKSVDVKDDKQVQALVDSKAPTICLVAKGHKWQVTDILKATPEENYNMIYDTVSYLRNEHGRRVFVDMEHFFDGYKYDSDYAIKCCEVAVKAGASALVLCDTNGGSMPWEIAKICQSVSEHFNSDSPKVTIGIHCHNDCGMAVANSLVAAKHGAGMIQGTINGIGERTGNADLISIIPSLALHMETDTENDDGTGKNKEEGCQMTCRPNLSNLVSLSRYVDEVLNQTPQHKAPYVGSSAFAHKGGLHVAAMERNPLSYQHIDPELVGNKKRILISELSGRANIMDKMRSHMSDETGAVVSEKAMSERAVAILNRVKELESKGYTFEGAEASVDLMILHSTKGFCTPFKVLDYSANVYDYDIDMTSRVTRKNKNKPEEDFTSLSSTSSTARATVKVRTMRNPDNNNDSPLVLSTKNNDDYNPYYEDRLEVADGNGPVDALANALMRALVPSHPYLNEVELVDYKVRILDPESATGATTRAMIEFRDSDKRSWTTVSVDTNVISASLNALIDGFEYALIEYSDSCMLCEDDFFLK